MVIFFVDLCTLNDSVRGCEHTGNRHEGSEGGFSFQRLVPVFRCDLKESAKTSLLKTSPYLATQGSTVESVLRPFIEIRAAAEGIMSCGEVYGHHTLQRVR